MIFNRELILPTESITAISTNILNVNFDCLHAILSSECLSPLDLCSIGESHFSLKVVVDEVFAERHGNYQIKLSQIDERDRTNWKRIFSNFGSLISTLLICLKEQCRSRESGPLLDLVSEYCSDRLESLELVGLDITHGLAIKLSPLFQQLKKISLKWCRVYAAKTLFAKCESLVELSLWIRDFDVPNLVLENTFPKLDRFEYWTCKFDAMSDSILYDFFSRHKNLEALNLFRSRFDRCDESRLLPSVVHKRKVNFENHVNNIATLEHLKTLKISWTGEIMTKFMQGLEYLKSLDFLSLNLNEFDSKIVPALLKLTKLRVLELFDYGGLTNLNSFADLEQLTELKIISSKVLDFDLVYIIYRLFNLKSLHLHVKSFQMDNQMHLQIVDVLLRKPGRLQDALQVTCFTSRDFVADLNFDHILRITRLHYSTSA